MDKPRVWTEENLDRLQKILEEKYPKAAEFLYYPPAEGESTEFVANGYAVTHYIPTATLYIQKTASLEIKLPESLNNNPDLIIDLICANMD